MAMPPRLPNYNLAIPQLDLPLTEGFLTHALPFPMAIPLPFSDGIAIFSLWLRHRNRYRQLLATANANPPPVLRQCIAIFCSAAADIFPRNFCDSANLSAATITRLRPPQTHRQCTNALPAMPMATPSDTTHFPQRQTDFFSSASMTPIAMNFGCNSDLIFLI